MPSITCGVPMRCTPRSAYLQRPPPKIPSLLQEPLETSDKLELPLVDSKRQQAKSLVLVFLSNSYNGAKLHQTPLRSLSVLLSFIIFTHARLISGPFRLFSLLLSAINTLFSSRAPTNFPAIFCKQRWLGTSLLPLRSTISC